LIGSRRYALHLRALFKLTPPKDGKTAWTETTLWTFSGRNDGGCPVAPLIADERGALYGTAQFGAAVTAPNCVSAGCGVVMGLTGTRFVPPDRDK